MLITEGTDTSHTSCSADVDVYQLQAEWGLALSQSTSVLVVSTFHGNHFSKCRPRISKFKVEN
jgi:hypothetical protein